MFERERGGHGGVVEVELAVAPVRVLLATAVEDGLIRSNPCAGLRLATGRVDLEGDEFGGARALTPAEYARLLEKLPDEWRLLVRVMAETGLRIGELLALTCGDSRSRSEADPRSAARLLGEDRAAEEPLRPSGGSGDRCLAGALSQARGGSRYALDADPVFASVTGSRLDPGNLHGRFLKPAARAAKVEWVGFHTLRHTCATDSSAAA